MIARLWRATATTPGAAAYAAHFDETVLPSLRALNGFHIAYLLNRDTDHGTVEIEVISFWDSLDSIRAFTGDRELDTAVVEPEAQAVLTSFDETVRHFDVVL